MQEIAHQTAWSAAAPLLVRRSGSRLSAIGRVTRSRAGNIVQYVAILGITGYTIYAGSASMGYNWQWNRVPPYILRIRHGEIVWGTLALGLCQTILISAYAGLVAACIGIATAVFRLSRSFSGRWLARLYLELVRNTPLLVEINLFYFVVAPVFGIDRFWTGVLALAFFEGAFASEIFRAGILAVPAGQWEASSALGLSRLRTYLLVVLPQAVRIMLPPLVSICVALIKDSSIVSVIALFELTTAGRDAIADSFMSFEIWLTVAAIYLLLNASFSITANRLNRHMRIAT